MDYQDVYLFAGLYGGPDEARSDYEELGRMHKSDIIGKYQAALFEKQSDGKVKVLDTTSTTRSTGAKWGLGIGAVLGLLFPPSILAGAVTGAAVGGLGGNLSKGWFKGDVKRLADELQPGQAGIVAVAEAGPAIEESMILTRASKTENERVTGEDAEKMREQLASEQTVGAGTR